MILLFPLFILEIVLSIQMGIAIGAGYAVLWTFGSMLLSVILIKSSHIALASGADQIFTGKLSIQKFHNSALSYLTGAILLFIPGVLSDSFGLILLIYTLYLHFVAKITPQNKHNQFNPTKESEDVIDVEIINSDDDRLSKS